MAINRILALTLLVVGLILIFSGYQSSQGLGDQVTQTVSGNFTDATVVSASGAAAMVAGSAVTGIEMLLFGKTTRK